MENHTDGNKKRWYLIYTKAKGEEVAHDNLLRQGFHAYLPKVKLEKRLRGKYRPFVEALFPRYLFIQLDTQTDNWMPIRSTIGVSNMVRFGGLPAQVPAELVSELQKNGDENGVHCERDLEYQQGQEVELIAGSLNGYRAIFDKYVSGERISVLLDIVGKHTRMLISRHDVKLA